MKRYRWIQPNATFLRLAVKPGDDLSFMDMLDTDHPKCLTQEKLSAMVEEIKLGKRGPMTEDAYKKFMEVIGD
jgi:hypothetical protein